MSDAVRNYSGTYSSPRPTSRGLFRGGRRLTQLLLILLLLGTGCAFWIARDTHEIHEFVPVETEYLITSQDLVQNRDRFLGSSIWKALPESWASHPILELLNTQISTKDWVLRNVLGQRILIYGHDSETFSDAVYIMRMTAVGTLLERNYHRRDYNVYDPAGGLNLRWLVDHDLYYSVRGRLIVASTSREALIRALTLKSEETFGVEDWDDSLWPTGDEDVRGLIHLTTQNNDTPYFKALGFAARFEGNQGLLKLNLPHTEAFYQEFNLDSLGSKIPRMTTPVEGPISLSSNMNIDVEAMWSLLGEIDGASLFLEPMWEQWGGDSPESSMPAYVGTILGDVDTSYALTWHGFNLRDIVPTSTYSMVTSYEGDRLAMALNTAQEKNDSIVFSSLQTRFNEEQNWLEINSMGADSMTTVLYETGVSSVLLTSSLIKAKHIKDEKPSGDSLGEGHFYIRLFPKQIVQEYGDFSLELLEGGLLADENGESFQKTLSDWKQKYSTLKEVSLMAQYNHNERAFDVELRIKGLDNP